MLSLTDTIKPVTVPLAGASILGICLLDLFAPAGTAVWVAYLLPLLFTLWGAGRRAYLALLVICTGLLVVAVAFTTPGLPKQISMLNRAIGAGVIWAATLFILPWHRAQGALLESRRTLDTLLNNLPGMAYRCVNAPNWPFTFASGGCLALTGYQPDRLVAGQPHYGDLIHPDDQGTVWEQVQAAVSARAPYELAYRIRTAVGSERWVWEQGQGVFDPDGGLLFLEGFISDITERKRAEADLEAAYQRLSFHVDNSPMAVVEWGPDFRVQRWSSQAERIFGWQASEVLGKHPTEWPFVYVEDQKAVDEVMARLLDGRERRNTSGNRNYKKDGEVVHCEWYNSVLHDRKGSLVSILSLVLDVSERQQLQEQVMQAQKMEAIGRLTGGIAHDFNNLLTGINGYAELLLEDRAPDDPDRSALEQIQFAGERAAALTHQLLAFSRKQVLTPKVLDLNRVIANMQKLLRRLIGEDIDLTVHPGPDLGSVKVDPGQVEQVFMNLVVNARDATPSGGRVTIETHNVELDDLYAVTHPGVDPGAYVMLAVSDTGRGMDRDTQARIFEPFFTTKETGKGTGLGLSTVYGIIKQSRGHVLVYSELDKGTTFKILLPRVDETPESALLPAPTEGLRGSEVILLAEDEDVVRGLAKRALERYGYTVIEAADGDQALRASREYSGTIHLLLTDTVMPRMSGVALERHISADRAGTLTLFMSGYADRGIVEHEILGAGKPFLQKPFTAAALARKVREVLSGPAGPRSGVRQSPGEKSGTHAINNQTG